MPLAPSLPATVFATVDHASTLNPVSDDPTAAVGAARGQLLDCALEAVEDVVDTTEQNLEGSMVVVAAYLTSRRR